MSYRYYNPNPLSLQVGDCTIRAISKLTDSDWKITYLELIIQGYMMADMPSSNRVWGEYLKQHGYEQHFIPDRCPDCYTVNDFANENPRGKFLLATGAHVIAVIDGDYYDSWDSGREIPIYYFKES